MNTNTLTPETLRRAADLAASIQKQQAELNALLAGRVLKAAPKGRVIKTKNGQRRVLSPEAIKAIRDGQKRRWARVHAAAPAVESAAAPVAETS